MVVLRWGKVVSTPRRLSLLQRSSKTGRKKAQSFKIKKVCSSNKENKKKTKFVIFFAGTAKGIKPDFKRERGYSKLKFFDIAVTTRKNENEFRITTLLLLPSFLPDEMY